MISSSNYKRREVQLDALFQKKKKLAKKLLKFILIKRRKEPINSTMLRNIKWDNCFISFKLPQSGPWISTKEMQLEEALDC